MRFLRSKLSSITCVLYPSLMKKLFLLLIIFCPCIIFAQDAKLNISLTNSTSTNCHIWMPDMALTQDYLKKGTFDISLKAGKGSHIFKLTKPQYAYLMYSNSDADSAKLVVYMLYLSPGNDINFKADLKNKGNGIVVTGKGSNNNHTLVALLADEHLESLWGDTLPNRIIVLAKKHQNDLKVALKKYISLYMPTPDFIKNEEINIKYDAVYQYYEYKENNKYGIQESYAHNEPKWEAIQDSLFATIKLNNDEALTAFNYTLLIRTFLGREKERLWMDSHKNPEAFYKQWYNTDVNTGKKEFEADMQNLLKEKIIKHYFTGRSAEFLYATLFDEALAEHNPKNLVSIFDGFKLKYPGSKYVGWFQPSIDTIREMEKKPLTANMVFVPHNGTDLNTFNDVLALTKGKTVLLDMWGTWCGPCRESIEKNAAAIETHFAGKGLSYYYIANYDMAHEKTWKEMIAYFNMQGTHILANDSLSNNIMTTVKSNGFPTYVIIKKDGTWELSKAGYPMDRDVN